MQRHDKQIENATKTIQKLEMEKQQLSNEIAKLKNKNIKKANLAKKRKARKILILNEAELIKSNKTRTRKRKRNASFEDNNDNKRIKLTLLQQMEMAKKQMPNELKSKMSAVMWAKMFKSVLSKESVVSNIVAQTQKLQKNGHCKDEMIAALKASSSNPSKSGNQGTHRCIQKTILPDLSGSFNWTQSLTG